MIHNQLINILDIREILEYGFAPMVLGKISQEQTALSRKISGQYGKKCP